MEPSDPFAALADEAAANEAASRRAQAHWLQRQAAEEATLAGTLLDLAESGADVSLRSRSGRLHRGAITSVGGDFVVIGDTWIPFAAVVAVRSAVATSTGGDRAPARDVRLGDALAELAPGRPSVVIVPAAGEPLRGELVAVGADVLTLALAGDVASRCHVPLAALAEVVVLG